MNDNIQHRLIKLLNRLTAALLQGIVHSNTLAQLLSLYCCVLCVIKEPERIKIFVGCQLFIFYSVRQILLSSSFSTQRQKDIKSLYQDFVLFDVKLLSGSKFIMPAAYVYCFCFPLLLLLLFVCFVLALTVIVVNAAVLSCVSE